MFNWFRRETLLQVIHHPEFLFVLPFHCPCRNPTKSHSGLRAQKNQRSSGGTVQKRQHLRVRQLQTTWKNSQSKKTSLAVYMGTCMVHIKEWKKWYKSKYALANSSNLVPSASICVPNACIAMQHT